MARGNSQTYVKYNELPRINGIYVESIWRKKPSEHEFDQDYYYLCKSCYSNDRTIKVKKLPDLIQQFFGPQSINGNYVDVSTMLFRTTDSGHASHDYTISLSGLAINGQTKSFSLYMGFDYFYPAYMIDKNSAYGKELYSIVGKKFDDPWQSILYDGKYPRYKDVSEVEHIFGVPELPNWHDVEFPHSYFRVIGGLVYPDVKYAGWRWHYGEPYIAQTPGDNSNIRVYFEAWHAHLYLQKVVPEKGDEELIMIDFARAWDKKPDQFCRINCWSNSQQLDAGGIIKYRIKNIDKSGFLTIAAMINDQEQHSKVVSGGDFYRIMKISKIR